MLGGGCISTPPQVKQENKQLKRLSLAPTAPPALPMEVPPEEEPDPAQHYGQQLEGESDWGVPVHPQPERVKPEPKSQSLSGCPIPVIPKPGSARARGFRLCLGLVLGKQQESDTKIKQKKR